MNANLTFQRTLVLATLDTVKRRIAESIDAHGLTASGRTADSMHVDETEQGGTLYGRQYFQGLQIGRPAGRVPRDFRDIIKQWITDKGLTVQQIPYKTVRPHKYTVEERSLDIAAGAISHTIQTEGDKTHRDGIVRDVYDTIIREEVERLKASIGAGMTAYIKNEYSTTTGLRL